jgi:hypothetical protein
MTEEDAKKIMERLKKYTEETTPSLVLGFHACEREIGRRRTLS